MKINKKIILITFITFIAIVIMSICIIQFNRLSIINKFINYTENDNLCTHFDLSININGETKNNLTTEENYSKDRIDLLKQLKNLKEIERIEFNEESFANMFIIIEDNNIFYKDRYNHYFAKLDIYLDENIICLNILGEKYNENSTIKKTYYKMDNYTKELAEKIINDVINQRS